MNVVPVLSKCIKLYREAGGTQSQLSDISGVGRVTIVRLEAEQYRNPTFNTVVRLMKPLGLRLDDFVVDNQERQASPRTTRDGLFGLIVTIVAVLDTYCPEELFPGCHSCLTGKCNHDTKEQFAYMLRSAARRMCRSRGWKIEGR
jgi:DNA-binding XRE family transcriptional regulator